MRTYVRLVVFVSWHKHIVELLFMFLLYNVRKINFQQMFRPWQFLYSCVQYLNRVKLNSDGFMQLINAPIITQLWAYLLNGTRLPNLFPHQSDASI